MNKTSLLELAKKLNIPCRNCMKTKEELEKAIKDTITKYKEIIFGPDSPVCVACLNELQNQQVFDKKVFDQKLMDDTMRKFAWDELQKNIVMDGDVVIDGKTGEVLDPEVEILRVDFIVSVDHKITCRKVEKLLVLNGTGTLNT